MMMMTTMVMMVVIFLLCRMTPVAEVSRTPQVQIRQIAAFTKSRKGDEMI